MDKKLFAVFKKNKIEIDEFDRLEIEEALNSDKKVIILRGKRLRVSDFIEFREEDTENMIEKLQKRWIESVKNRLEMSPKERANTTKGHFSFWFWSVFKKQPTNEIWEKAKIAIQKFYEKNPKMIYPYIKFYFELVKGSKNKVVNEHALRILERIEDNLINFNKKGAVDNLLLTKPKQGV